MPDSDDKFPDKLVLLQEFKTDRHRQKRCDCYSWLKQKKLSFTYDVKNREIVCDHCGNAVDPFEVFELIAKRDDELNRHAQQLFAQAEECRDYKPWRVAIKYIEQQFNGGKMLPTCPHCHKAVLLDEIAYGTWVNKERELQARRFEERGRD